MFNNKITILSEFFKIVRPLIKYKYTREIKMLYNTLLKYLLTVLEKEDLYYECFNLLNKTLGLQTQGDALAVNIDLVNNDEEKKVIEIKSKYIMEDKITSLQLFDNNIFINNLINDANKGVIESCKLYSVLSYLGVYTEKNVDTSILMATMLAYNGDLFSMCFLNNLYKNMNCSEKEKIWNEIKKIYQISKKNIIPLALGEKCDYKLKLEDNVVNVVQIILCLENRNVEKERITIDIPLTYYLITSEDSYQEKIQNIYSDESGYVVLLKSEINRNRKYEF